MKAGYPPEDQLDKADLAAANWAWGNDRPAGRGSDTLPGAKRLFLPMRTGRGAIGVIGIDDDRTGPLLTPDQRRCWTRWSIRARSPSSACCWSRTWTGSNVRWNPIGCAARC